MAFGDILQSKSLGAHNQNTITLAFDDDPTPGNLIIILRGTGGTDIALPIGFVTSRQRYNSADDDKIRQFHRVVQTGDGKEFSSTSTSGTEDYAVMWEIEGPFSEIDTVEDGSNSAISTADDLGMGSTDATAPSFISALVLIRHNADVDVTASTFNNSFTTEEAVQAPSANYKTLVVGARTIDTDGTYTTTLAIPDGATTQNRWGFLVSYRGANYLELTTPETTAVGDELIAFISHDNNTNIPYAYGWTTQSTTYNAGAGSAVTILHKTAETAGANDYKFMPNSNDEAIYGHIIAVSNFASFYDTIAEGATTGTYIVAGGMDIDGAGESCTELFWIWTGANSLTAVDPAIDQIGSRVTTEAGYSWLYQKTAADPNYYDTPTRYWEWSGSEPNTAVGLLIKPTAGNTALIRGMSASSKTATGRVSNGQALAGDLMVAQIQAPPGVTPDAPPGWTYAGIETVAGSATGDNRSAYYFWRVAPFTYNGYIQWAHAGGIETHASLWVIKNAAGENPFITYDDSGLDEYDAVTIARPSTTQSGPRTNIVIIAIDEPSASFTQSPNYYLATTRSKTNGIDQAGYLFYRNDTGQEAGPAVTFDLSLTTDIQAITFSVESDNGTTAPTLGDYTATIDEIADSAPAGATIAVVMPNGATSGGAIARIEADSATAGATIAVVMPNGATSGGAIARIETDSATAAAYIVVIEEKTGSAAGRATIARAATDSASAGATIARTDGADSASAGATVARPQAATAGAGAAIARTETDSASAGATISRAAADSAPASATIARTETDSAAGRATIARAATDSAPAGATIARAATDSASAGATVARPQAATAAAGAAIARTETDSASAGATIATAATDSAPASATIHATPTASAPASAYIEDIVESAASAPARAAIARTDGADQASAGATIAAAQDDAAAAGAAIARTETDSASAGATIATAATDSAPAGATIARTDGAGEADAAATAARIEADSASAGATVARPQAATAGAGAAIARTETDSASAGATIATAAADSAPASATIHATPTDSAPASAYIEELTAQADSAAARATIARAVTDAAPAGATIARIEPGEAYAAATAARIEADSASAGATVARPQAATAGAGATIARDETDSAGAASTIATAPTASAPAGATIHATPTASAPASAYIELPNVGGATGRAVIARTDGAGQTDAAAFIAISQADSAPASATIAELESDSASAGATIARAVTDAAPAGATIARTDGAGQTDAAAFIAAGQAATAGAGATIARIETDSASAGATIATAPTDSASAGAYILAITGGSAPASAAIARTDGAGQADAGALIRIYIEPQTPDERTSTPSGTDRSAAPGNNQEERISYPAHKPTPGIIPGGTDRTSYPIEMERTAVTYNQTMPTKDPEETTDYKIFWSREVGAGATIVDHTVEISGSVTLEADEVNDDNDIIVWLSGGTPGETCRVTSKIEADTGGPVTLKRQWSIFIPIADV